MNELLGVATMSAGNGVSAEHDLQPWELEGLLHHRRLDRDVLLHEHEAFLGVIADADEFLLVLEVVVGDEKLRLEEHAAIDQRLENRVVRTSAVRHRVTSC